MKPDRHPVAAHHIHLAPVLGFCVPERVERGVRSHPKSCRIRISNYFCLGTYDLPDPALVKVLHPTRWAFNKATLVLLGDRFPHPP